jgi:hypothetical protein
MLEEIAPACNIVERAVEFEKKRFSRLKDPERFGAAARLPEIHLVDPRDMGNDIEPVVIRDADPNIHSANTSDLLTDYWFPCRL